MLKRTQYPYRSGQDKWGYYNRLLYFAILLLIVFVIFPAFNSFPPLFIFLIPVYCLMKISFKIIGRLPIKFGFNFSPIDCIPAVMSGAVFDRFDSCIALT